MPEEGIRYLPKKELLSFEEIERLVRILAPLGVSKIRLTGGEPFLRNDLMALIRKITDTQGINEVHITTNGILTTPHVAELKALGIASVNLSLDTLDRERFKTITRRDEFDKTWKAFQLLMEHNIPVKLNAVVMEGKNEEDILPLVELTRQYPIAVRFIEEMPFNGGDHAASLSWTYTRILEKIREQYLLEKLPDEKHATAYRYQVPGFVGNIGVIAAFSRTFCGSCNRIRLTAQGVLKTCLYDNGVMNIRNLLRAGKSDEEIKEVLIQVFQNRPKDGFEAEEKRKNVPVTESMSTIGG